MQITCCLLVTHLFSQGQPANMAQMVRLCLHLVAREVSEGGEGGGEGV